MVKGMLPTVFLSLSGTDKPFVDKVYKHLPAGLAHYYPKSFDNGEKLIEAMEERVPSSKIFALFASRASIDSVWVNFEIEKARVSKIKDKYFKVIVFTIEAGLTSRDLPEWMRDYWVPGLGLSPRDISRYIRNLLSKTLYDSLQTSQVFGRGGLIDKTCNQYLANSVTNKISPNVILFGGHDGIGRRTLARKVIGQINPALPNINGGPEFILPQFADLEDVYRSLRQEISDGLSIDDISKESDAFRSLDQAAQVREVCRCLSYFETLGQAVWIVSGNVIFEDRGTLKGWARQLFSDLRRMHGITLCLITNRLIHEAEARPHPNVFQIHVGNISNMDINSLMIAVMKDFGVNPVMPSETILSSIGGHPQIARIVASIAASQGMAVLEHDPKTLYDIQEEILGSSVDLSVISSHEQKLLSILSWVPQLSSDLLSQVMIGEEGLNGREFSTCLSNLERSCLVQSSGASYSIASPIRMLFRRKYGYGSESLRKSFSNVLKSVSEKTQRGEDVDIDLIDALIFMASIEGGSLDPVFQKLLLPSRLQEIIQSNYYEKNYSRVVQWGAPAKTMKMDEAAREAILSYVIRAHCRLDERSPAKTLLDFFDLKIYRSRHYLRAFYIRHCDGDISEAIEHLKKAYAVKKYMKSVVADLALCYQKQGDWDAIKALIESEGDKADENAGLLDVKAGIQINRRQFTEAEITIRKLNSHPHGDGRGNSRIAMIMMHRDQDFTGAQRFLTERLQEKGTNVVPTRRLRAIAAAYAGDRATVENDIAFLKHKPDGPDTTCRLMARLLLTEGNPDEALREISKVLRRSHQDELLRARIIEAKSEDPRTPLHLVKSLQEESLVIRSKHNIVSEFEPQ